MAKVKKIGSDLNSDLVGGNFTNITSNTIFSLGKFSITSNFDGKNTIDYSTELSSFVRPVTLETLDLTETQSEILNVKTNSIVLNLDKSDLKTFVRFGSAYEFLRVTIENIILSYPGSLLLSSESLTTNAPTAINYIYNEITNESEFEIPANCVINNFGITYDRDNYTIIDDNKLKNLNLSFNDYVIWSTTNPENNTNNIIEFSGSINNVGNIGIRVKGNPFPFVGGTGDTIYIDYHIKPNITVFEEYRERLGDYGKHLISERDGVNGFNIKLKEPSLLSNGKIVYVDKSIIWNTIDGYNIEFNSPSYRRFLETVLLIGAKYDTIKTDLIARFLTPQSLKTYDLTDDGKMTKLLRIYGREFDELRGFIDSLVHINKVSYDKIENIPDILVKNLAKTFGWDYFSLLNEGELVESFFSIDESERNLKTDLMPSEIDIELWRRILLNTNYFWKTKGTRDAIKSMFLLIGIPEQFVNITEYVYTVDGKIDPRDVLLSKFDFPTNTYPFYDDGNPKAPIEDNDFYFQVAGNRDGGEEYMNVFRRAGFTLIPNKDNKKSWVEGGSVIRKHSTTPQYHQLDSKLVLNTKAIDIALDAAQGIEQDVYTYINEIDFPANSSGYTLPFSYVNINTDFSNNTFNIPSEYSKTEGDVEVRLNGVLLNPPKEINSNDILNEPLKADYSITGNTIELKPQGIDWGGRGDVVQVSFIYSGDTQPVTGITINYIVTRIKPNNLGTEIPLPSSNTIKGDVQLTINGIALTRSTESYSGDYIFDRDNDKIIIQNSDIIGYLKVYVEQQIQIQIAYIEVDGSDNILIKNEVYKIRSFDTSKLYYNSTTNKYTYVLNYKVNSVKDIKVLVNGIMLSPNNDYIINPDNPFEVFLPKTLKYGYVISIYYLVGGDGIFFPIVSDDFGLGDISELSFLEFINLAKNKMINARTRKTISDFKGGWYPTILKIYQTYVKRSYLSDDDTLQSNGYTFNMLYPFLSKYNTFFQKFVEELLPTTIIMRKSGLLVRNTIFTQQKFMYKRGVSLVRDNNNAHYFGDDGSMFKKTQTEKPAPIELDVETNSGVARVYSIDGVKGVVISGSEIITSYGFKYREVSSLEWITILINEPLPSNNEYQTDIIGLEQDTLYQYKAIINSGTLSAEGREISTRTNKISPIPNPSITTIEDDNITGNVIKTGGDNIVRHGEATEYGILYRKIPNILTKPVVETITQPMSLITCNTADVSGKIIDKGNSCISQYGILYKMGSCVDIDFINDTSTTLKSGVCIEEGSNPANVQINTTLPFKICGLSPETKYYYRFFARNSGGYTNGNIRDFTTPGDATPDPGIGGFVVTPNTARFEKVPSLCRLTVSIPDGCAWSVLTNDPSVVSVSCIYPRSGVGTGSFDFKPSVNSEYDNRSGSINVSSESMGTYLITFTQDGEGAPMV